MALIRVLMSAAILGTAVPSAAAAQEAMQSAIISYSQAGTDSDPARSDGRTPGTVHVAAMSGMLDVDAAAHSLREKQRRTTITHGGYAEAALLTGAGLLSPISQLELPACVDEEDKPGFDCRIPGNQKAGRARSRGDGIPLPRPIERPLLPRP